MCDSVTLDKRYWEFSVRIHNEKKTETALQKQICCVNHIIKDQFICLFQVFTEKRCEAKNLGTPAVETSWLNYLTAVNSTTQYSIEFLKHFPHGSTQNCPWPGYRSPVQSSSQTCVVTFDIWTQKKRVPIRPNANVIIHSFVQWSVVTQSITNETSVVQTCPKDTNVRPLPAWKNLIFVRVYRKFDGKRKAKSPNCS